MGQYRGYLGLLVGEGEQAGVDADHAAGDGEGVQGLVVDQGDGGVDASQVAVGHQAADQCLHIVLGQWVAPFRHVGAKLA